MTSPSLPLSRETSIRRDARGQWFHEGARVENEAVARAFDRWVGRAEDGRYILQNDVNWAYVEIEGPPVFVLSAVPDGGTLTLQLSDGRVETLAPETLRQDPEGRLYCDVRGGRLWAGFSRRATLELEPLLAEDEAGLYLALGGARVRPPERDDVSSRPAPSPAGSLPPPR
jgi:hypothetical protein